MSMTMDGATVKGAFTISGRMIGGEDDNDLRGLSLKQARVGVMDLRGRKILLSAFDGARFGRLSVDEQTQAYDDNGEKLRGRVTVSGEASESEFKQFVEFVRS